MQQTLELTPNAQIWPRSLNSSLGGEDGKIYLITADLGSNSGSGLDFIGAFMANCFIRREMLMCVRRIRIPPALLLRVRHDQQPCWVCHYGVHGRNYQLMTTEAGCTKCWIFYILEYMTMYF